MVALSKTDSSRYRERWDYGEIVSVVYRDSYASSRSEQVVISSERGPRGTLTREIVPRKRPHGMVEMFVLRHSILVYYLSFPSMQREQLSIPPTIVYHTLERAP